jgi:hypothetical protein
MALNQGNNDNAANTPLWVAAAVNRQPSSAEAQLLYGNTSSGAYFAGETVGVFAVDDNEALVDGNTGTGWVLRTTGSGGRAGRVTEEVLSVVASFRSDNNSDDSVYPDSKLTISTQPSATSVRANTANANVASFSVAVFDVQPVGSTVTYVWQFNTADGLLGWTNVLNGSGNQIGNTTFAGNTSSTMTVAPANTAANLRVFRVNATVTPPAGITNATATTVTSSNAQITIL